MVVEQEGTHVIFIHALLWEAESLCDFERGHIGEKWCSLDLASCTKVLVANLVHWRVFTANLAFIHTQICLALREVHQFATSCKLVLYPYSAPLLKRLVHILVVLIRQHVIEAFTARP